MTPVLRLSLSILALTGLLLAAVFLPRSAAAQGIPVNDATAILRLADQYIRQGLIYARQNEELTEALRLTRSIVGCASPPCNLGLGSLHQTPALRRIRRSLPRADARSHPAWEIPGRRPESGRAAWPCTGDLTDRYGLLEEDAYEPQATRPRRMPRPGRLTGTRTWQRRSPPS